MFTSPPPPPPPPLALSAPLLRITGAIHSGRYVAPRVVPRQPPARATAAGNHRGHAGALITPRSAAPGRGRGLWLASSGLIGTGAGHVRQSRARGRCIERKAGRKRARAPEGLDWGFSVGALIAAIS